MEMILKKLRKECSFPISILYVDACEDFKSINKHILCYELLKKVYDFSEDDCLITPYDNIDIESYLNFALNLNKNSLPKELKTISQEIDKHYSINIGTSSIYLTYAGVIFLLLDMNIPECSDDILNYFSKVKDSFLELMPKNEH